MGTLAETWQKQGEAKGLAAGKVEGLAKGLAEGEAKSLMRLLVKRFGPLPEPVVAQIAAGSIEELDRWVDRVLDTPTLKAKRRDHLSGCRPAPLRLPSEDRFPKVGSDVF